MLSLADPAPFLTPRTRTEAVYHSRRPQQVALDDFPSHPCHLVIHVLRTGSRREIVTAIFSDAPSFLRIFRTPEVRFKTTSFQALRQAVISFWGEFGFEILPIKGADDVTKCQNKLLKLQERWLGDETGGATQEGSDPLSLRLEQALTVELVEEDNDNVSPAEQFVIDPARKYITYADPIDLLRLHYSHSVVTLNPQGGEKQECRAFVCALRQQGKVRLYAALYLLRDQRSLIYLPKRPPTNMETFLARYETALKFMDVCGFVMDELRLSRDPRERSNLLKNVVILKHQRPEVNV
ncbi:MAG: hypothetical protein C0621_04050 [Desulfuromonas sp.]|nr:MAG: hypothetical protein C0621_04050 [Desulfuromonas sp.]